MFGEALNLPKSMRIMLEEKFHDILNNNDAIRHLNGDKISCLHFTQEFHVESQFQQVDIRNLNFDIRFRRHFR